MNIQNSPYLSALQQVNIADTRQVKTPDSSSIGFGNVLDEKLKAKEVSDVKFSKHAMGRLNQRGITISDDQMKRLAQGMDKASGKGLKEPLVLIDDIAFIVSTDKKTVITAAMQQQTEESVFTNIDGAVIN